MLEVDDDWLALAQIVRDLLCIVKRLRLDDDDLHLRRHDILPDRSTRMKIDYIACLFLLMISIAPQRFFLLLLCSALLAALPLSLFFFGQGQLFVLIWIREAKLATNLIDHIHLKHSSISLCMV